MKSEHWIAADEWPELISRVSKIQSSMAEPARARFCEENLDHLNVLIRLTVEFSSYLRRTTTASPDDEKLIREYVCDSVFGGIESFRWVAFRYRGLNRATSTKIGWKSLSGTVSSSFNEEFFIMFDEFLAESSFEHRCRLLLDLFKLQIMFAGISYE